MGLIEKFSSKADEQELAKEASLPVGNRLKDNHNQTKKTVTSDKPDIPEGKENNPSNQEEGVNNVATEIFPADTADALIDSLIAFNKSYNPSQNESKMLRLQRKNYKSLLKLKLDDVATAKFLNFALAHVFASKDFDTIIKYLKKPK